ncbi:MAG: hypothetical protein M3680_18670 [Myxococcota bacterium]|nr:hypothetical protein [Myxococcota bacterium]
MQNPRNRPDEDPSLDGPDYVALVIEWDEIADDLEDEITQRTPTPGSFLPAAGPARTPAPSFAPIGKVLGALGVLLLARWGVRRLRHA